VNRDSRKSLVPVAVHFLSCEVGWIKFCVKAGTQSVNIHASDVFDPFPDLLAWLEAVAVNVQECAFIIDEEGYELEFRIKRIEEDDVFTISGWGEPGAKRDYLSASVDRLQLVRAFYDGIRQFSISPTYVPSEWDYVPIAGRLLEILGDGWNHDQLIVALTRLNASELNLLFSSVESNAFSTTDEYKQNVARWLVHPDAEEIDEAWACSTRGWIIDSDYDSWGTSRRQAYLREYVTYNLSSWSGVSLRELHSEIVETRLRAL